MFYIYILYSNLADKYYIGQTSDVQKRLYEHNHPIETTKFTAKFIPWVLLTDFPVSENRADALKIERFIKNQKSKKFILKLLENKGNKEFYDELIKHVLKIG